MEITRYRDCGYEELMRAQKSLEDSLYWFQEGEIASKSHRDVDLLNPKLHEINQQWKNPSFWYIPKPFIENHSIEGKYRGCYDLPLHAFLNEEFGEFIIGEKYDGKAQRLIKESKSNLSLIRRKDTLARELNIVQDEFREELKRVAGYLIHHIERNATKVERYDPGCPSEDGRKTRKMIELIDDAVLAFRGVMCGNIYAYEWLIGNYINTEMIDELWGYTSQIVDKSKEYLTLQMAVEYKKGAGKPTITKNEIDWFDNLILKLKEVEKDNKSVVRLFKDEVPDFQGDPNRNYFWGGLSQSAFGEAFSEIYKLKFGKVLGERRFRDLFTRDLENLRKR